MTTATAIYTSLLQPFHDGVRLPDATLVLAGLTVLFAIHLANHRGAFDRFHTLPAWQRFAVIGGATPVVYGLMPQATTPFIYFQF